MEILTESPIILLGTILLGLGVGLFLATIIYKRPNTSGLFVTLFTVLMHITIFYYAIVSETYAFLFGIVIIALLYTVVFVSKVGVKEFQMMTGILFYSLKDFNRFTLFIIVHAILVGIGGMLVYYGLHSQWG